VEQKVAPVIPLNSGDVNKSDIWILGDRY